MNFEKYQEAAKITDRTDIGYSNLHREISSEELRRLHMALGVAGEAGEMADAIKKAVFYRKPLDIENVIEEAGDILWYLANLLSSVDSSFDEAMTRNYLKLRARYPEGFTNADAIARKDKL